MGVLWDCNSIVPLGTSVSLGFENSVDAEFAGISNRKTESEMRWAQRFGYGGVACSALWCVNTARLLGSFHFGEGPAWW